MKNQLKERKRITLSNFLGYDFSSSPSNVAPFRALDGANFIHEDGVNRKRQGYFEVGRFNGRINGVYSFTAFNGDKHIIVHSGNRLYKYDLDNDVKTELAVNAEIADRLSYGVIANDKLWLFCGDYLMYGQWDGVWGFRRVFNSSDTYIPTTTISLSFKGDKEDISRVLDDVNILSTRRKNGFKTSEDELSYQVDTKLIDVGSVKITIRAYENDAYVERIYSNIDNGTQLFLQGSDEPFGVIDFGTGTITFNESVIPYSEEDNMTVEFTYKPRDESGTIIADYEKRITKCTFGALFGVGGNDNRLFIAGNSQFPNICFNSEENDLTYFPDTFTAVCGSTYSPITAFSRIGDGSLAVHKAYSGQEASVYYRHGILESITVGDKIAQRAVFPIRTGSMGEGAVTAFANADLDGDSLFLSKNGVFGIVLANNIATDMRYAKARSTLINGKLTKHNLSNAVGMVFGSRYYLSVDGVCYVADSRFKSGLNDNSDYNYEWWYWENIPARLFCIIDEALYFGTNDGRICRFATDGSFVDVTYTHTSDYTVDYTENKIIVNRDILPAVRDCSTVSIGGREYYVDLDSIVDDETSSFSLNYGVLVDDLDFSNGVISFVFKKSVVASWYTPIMDFGTNEYAKTLLAVTIYPESHISGDLEFGYETRHLERILNVHGVRLWDFNNIDFNNFTFDVNTFQRSYSIKIKERNFNYIMFMFKSSNEHDCAVNNITALYKINRINRGVQ